MAAFLLFLLSVVCVGYIWRWQDMQRLKRQVEFLQAERDDLMRERQAYLADRVRHVLHPAQDYGSTTIRYSTGAN